MFGHGEQGRVGPVVAREKADHRACGVGPLTHVKQGSDHVAGLEPGQSGQPVACPATLPVALVIVPGLKQEAVIFDVIDFEVVGRPRAQRRALSSCWTTLRSSGGTGNSGISHLLTSQSSGLPAALTNNADIGGNGALLQWEFLPVTASPGRQLEQASPPVGGCGLHPPTWRVCTRPFRDLAARRRRRLNSAA